MHNIPLTIWRLIVTFTFRSPYQALRLWTLSEDENAVVGEDWTHEFSPIYDAMCMSVGAFRECNTYFNLCV
jgi:hypothetical protein